MGYIYLLQPAELVGTDRYKIGLSSKDNLNRLRSYGIGTRYIFFMECNDYIFIENKLKEAFNKENCISLIKGKEYFQGSECNILKIFMKVVYKYKIKEIIDMPSIDSKIEHIIPDEIETKKKYNTEQSKSFYNNINKFKYKEQI